MWFTCIAYCGAMRRRTLFLAAATAPFLLGHPTAQATVAALDDDWLDARRDRSLPVRIRWPDGAAPCAVIVHSHGLGGSREGGDVWGEAWRGAGFAVVHVQHPGSDTPVMRAGMAALRKAASAEQWRARVADMQFVVDEITRRAQARDGAWARVRLEAIGASGHSFGAVTVQALAGQRFPVAATGIAEPRFKAFIAFSPSPGQGMAVTESFAAVTRPFLGITGTHDTDPLGRGLTGERRASVYEGLPRGRRALLWLDGADHMSFAGNAAQRLRARGGPLGREADAAEREPQHHRLVAALSALWWRAQLLDDTQALAALRAPPGLAQGDRWQQD